MFKLIEYVCFILLGIFTLGMLAPIPARAQIQTPDFSAIPSLSAAGCIAGKIAWRESAQGVKVEPDEASVDEASPKVISFGCLSQTEDFVIAITSFRGGKPDSFTVVPKGAVVAVMIYDPRPEAGKEPDKSSEKEKI